MIVCTGAAFAMSLLDLQNIHHPLGNGRALTLPTLTLGQDARLLLTGPSGAGKTTLLNLMSGLRTAAQGQIRFDGKDYADMSLRARDLLRRRHIGFVFQKLHLIGHLSAEQNIRLATDTPDPAQIGALMERLGIAGLRGRKARALSHGEAQRTAIARALAHKPKIVFADEPTSALDDAHAAAVIDLLLHETQANGAALIVATHDARIKAQFAHILEIPA